LKIKLFKDSNSVIPFVIATIILILAGFTGCKKKKVCPLGQKMVGKDCKCKVDSNCPANEVCKQGKCTKTVKKTSCPDVPCKDGKVCINGVCGPCSKNDQCKKGNYCKDGKCKPTGNQCSPDKDCPIGEKCLNGYCVKDSGPVPICSGDSCKSPCDLKTVWFNYKQSQLGKTSRENLKLNIKCIKKALGKGFKQVHLIGLCDPRGPSVFNDDLSSMRIKAVMDEMILIDPSVVNKINITTEPLGETCAMGTNEESWKKDRKVEFVWFKKRGEVCP
jgi:hypothetical protein